MNIFDQINHWTVNNVGFASIVWLAVFVAFVIVLIAATVLEKPKVEKVNEQLLKSTKDNKTS